jgi:phospholipase/carboxylesterase
MTGGATGPTRRRVVGRLLTLGATVLLSCRDRRGRSGPPERGQPSGDGDELADGRLAVQPPGAPVEPAPPAGLHPLGLGDRRDGLLFLPAGYRPEQPLPLVVMLHGAGGDAPGAMAPFVARAEEAGLVLVAPESRGRTWDALESGYGEDVAFIGRAVDHVTRRVAIDRRRVAVEGFSDGASYALGLGLANGDLFGRVVAFSPGFVPGVTRVGRPRVFVSHGVDDRVLPIDRCSRRLVPDLRRKGYDVHYVEFPEGHVVPPSIAGEALSWLPGG